MSNERLNQAIGNLERLIEERGEAESGPLRELLKGVREIKSYSFCEPSEALKWHEALSQAAESRARAMGEHGGKLTGEKAIAFELFLEDIESLEEPGFGLSDHRAFLIDDFIEGTDEIPRTAIDGSEALKRILGQFLFRFLTNDHEFFGEIARRMDIRGGKRERIRDIPDKAVAPFIAFRLGMELGHTPSRDAILQELKENGITPGDPTKFFRECGLGFLPSRKRGRPKKLGN